ncbi:orotate phosphoribosyltransferase [Maribellus comscasis]|uniref:Orotate phosphoribosyltransferase n=1 Tax=Maribellus comscasis TaxID=2681766 RepID=A0A6I6JSZ1_9BACT|nr:orotate phosphoribosyltransferase [Maribellus comscasis]QGY43257.1 orotate phosphoribosyltransferase [Maribellus comscasis]
MESTQIEVTKKLLEINTIKIQPSSPFTWASGWKSPIYCDNRKILSYPETRTFICDKFVELIREKYPDAEVIAGVATGAIAHGVLVADKLGLPFIYVRSKPKGHGLENLIEGDLKPGQKVVIIEDLVSTGVSSLKAAEAVSNFGGEVVGMVAIFTYNFPHAKENFKKAKVELTTLSRYQILIDLALAEGEITKEEVESLMEWREDPANWGK